MSGRRQLHTKTAIFENMKDQGKPYIWNFSKITNSSDIPRNLADRIGFAFVQVVKNVVEVVIIELLIQICMDGIDRWQSCTYIETTS